MELVRFKLSFKNKNIFVRLRDRENILGREICIWKDKKIWISKLIINFDI